jgi:hypothetical protein
MSTSDSQVTQARKDLGLPAKPRYTVPARDLLKLKCQWIGEPVAIAGPVATKTKELS